MKKILLVIFSICIVFKTNAQTYVALMPAFYTGAGTAAARSAFNVEVGKHWDVFSVGLDIGKINLAKKYGNDTTWFAKVRPNLSVFQQGKFTSRLGFLITPNGLRFSMALRHSTTAY